VYRYRRLRSSGEFPKVNLNLLEQRIQGSGIAMRKHKIKIPNHKPIIFILALIFLLQFAKETLRLTGFNFFFPFPSGNKHLVFSEDVVTVIGVTQYLLLFLAGIHLINGIGKSGLADFFREVFFETPDDFRESIRRQNKQSEYSLRSIRVGPDDFSPSNSGGAKTIVELDFNGEDVENLKKKSIEAVAHEISSDVKDKLVRDWISDYHWELQNTSMLRMQAQLIAIESRATRALTLGTTFCLAGALFLALFALTPSWLDRDSNTPLLENSWLEFAKYHLPKLSLVVTLEFIGFFFLKIFSSTLADVKYTHNEMTNLESKIISILWSVNQSDDKSFRDSVSKLAQTERNFIIRKGETTADLERERIAMQSSKMMFDGLNGFVHGSEKGSLWRGANKK
jgi:hypothetical protein